MSRIFEQFPQDLKPCPICGTNKQGKTILVPIPGTEDGNNMEANPVHLYCALLVSESYFVAMRKYND